MTELLSIERIRQYIDNDVQENLHLEYKASASLKGNIKLEELTKDVSAFANADGGTIIFGVIEGSKERKHFPEDLDEGFERSGKVNAIWLEDVLLGNIAPKIQGLKPYEIELGNGNFILVLEIPQSQYGPHMAKDNRYYKRRQTKAEPMEHYEVEDVRNRSRGPLLRATIPVSLNKDILHQRYYKRYSHGEIIDLNIQIENQADHPAEYAGLEFFLDWRLFSEIQTSTPKSSLLYSGRWDYADEIGIPIQNRHKLCRYYAALGLPNTSPIWKDNPVVVNLQLRLPQSFTDSEMHYVIGWRTTAPHMKLQSQFYQLNVLDHVNELVFEGLYEL